MRQLSTHLPSLFTAIIALLCASGTVLLVRAGRKRHERDMARIEACRMRDVAALAEWVDSTTGTVDCPAPGSVTLYTLWPLAEWPENFLSPNERTAPRCPLPKHDLRVVVPLTPDGPIWSATCQRCAAHWTATGAPPPVVVADQIHGKLAAAGHSVR